MTQSGDMGCLCGMRLWGGVWNYKLLLHVVVVPGRKHRNSSLLRDLTLWNQRCKTEKTKVSSLAINLWSFFHISLWCSRIRWNFVRCLKQLESYSRQNKVNTNAEVPVTFMDRSIWGWSGCLMNLKFIFNLCKTSAAAWTLFPHLISCSKKLKMWSRFSLKDPLSWEFCFAGFNMIL